MTATTNPSKNLIDSFKQSASDYLDYRLSATALATKFLAQVEFKADDSEKYQLTRTMLGTVYAMLKDIADPQTAPFSPGAFSAKEDIAPLFAALSSRAVERQITKGTPEYLSELAVAIVDKIIPGKEAIHKDKKIPRPKRRSSAYAQALTELADMTQKSAAAMRATQKRNAPG